MREISAEMKSKLAGLLPVNSDFTVEFIPPSYKEIPEEFRATFILKPWNANQAKSLSTIGSNEATAVKMIVSQIVDIRNLYNISTGELVEFDPVKIGDLIPKRILLEVMSELTRISGF
jgi:hypothetical protein